SSSPAAAPPVPSCTRFPDDADRTVAQIFANLAQGTEGDVMRRGLSCAAMAVLMIGTALVATQRREGAGQTSSARSSLTASATGAVAGPVAGAPSVTADSGSRASILRAHDGSDGSSWQARRSESA